MKGWLLARASLPPRLRYHSKGTALPVVASGEPQYRMMTVFAAFTLTILHTCLSILCCLRGSGSARSPDSTSCTALATLSAPPPEPGAAFALEMVEPSDLSRHAVAGRCPPASAGRPTAAAPVARVASFHVARTGQQPCSMRMDTATQGIMALAQLLVAFITWLRGEGSLLMRAFPTVIFIAALGLFLVTLLAPNFYTRHRQVAAVCMPLRAALLATTADCAC